MKKSIILLSSVFVVVIVGWLMSSLLIDSKVQMPRGIQKKSLPTPEINKNNDTSFEKKKIATKETSRISPLDNPSNARNNKVTTNSLSGESKAKTSLDSSVSTVDLGNFTSPDLSYSSRGQLTLRKERGRQFLDFKNFSVSNGPDLFVTLNKKSNPNSGSLGEHRKVQRLKNISGSQSYDITDIDLSEYRSLAIYCDRFSKVFSSVRL